MKTAEQKITADFSCALLARARKASRAGISDTVRKGLELLAASEAYDRLLNLKGKGRFSIDLNKLRRNRRFDRARHEFHHRPSRRGAGPDRV